VAEINLTAADLEGVLEGSIVNEEVLQQIIDVSRLPLILSDKMKSSSTGNKRFDWTMDRLPAPASITAVDGADIDRQDQLLGQRVGNEQQIDIREVRVSILAEASNSIGGAGKLARQVSRRGQDIMRGIELYVTGNNAAVVDDGDTVAGATASLEAWIDGNIQIPAETAVVAYTGTNARWTVSTGDGAGGTPDPTITGGGWENKTNALVDRWTYTVTTPLPMTEFAINEIMRALFENTGSRANRLGMSRPELHSKISAYYFTSSARIATLLSDTGTAQTAATAKGAVNAILSDYGIIDLEPNPIMPLADSVTASDTFYILMVSDLEFSNMTGFRVENLGKSGLSEKRLLSKTWGFKPLATESQGMAQGVDATEAMLSVGA